MDEKRTTVWNLELVIKVFRAFAFSILFLQVQVEQFNCCNSAVELINEKSWIGSNNGRVCCAKLVSAKMLISELAVKLC